MKIKIKRIYENYSSQDGFRTLVDRDLLNDYQKNK
jgi:uncharacterized protein YeaO (DUF488 family)